MICPECGKKIPDGNVYCENCGCEIVLVPDLEDTIPDKVPVNNIIDDEFIDDGMFYDEEPNVFSLILSGHAGGKVFYIGLVLVIVLVVFFASMFIKNLNSRNGLEYQLEMAESEARSNNLSAAISYLEAAYKIDKDISHLFTIADYYNELGRNNDAIFTLKEIADEKKNDENIRLIAYKRIISLYEEAKNYVKLNEMLEQTNIPSLKQEYSKYLVEAPVFNLEGGTYEEIIDIKIASGLQGGTIHYTFGNMEPTETSDIFVEPINLTYGSYTINAIYVNEFGIKSDVVTQKYLIDVDFVFEPEILLDSGNYTSAQLIEAKVPAMYTLYYTTDGTTPDKNSLRYTGPIALPLGESSFKFIEYAGDGTVSSVIERHYTLTYNSLVTEETAIPFLMNILVQRGVNSDIEGHRNNSTGNYIYIFTTAYNISGKGDYFFIVEYYKDEYGNTRKTGDIYAMHVVSADKIYKVTSVNGNYVLNNF